MNAVLRLRQVAGQKPTTLDFLKLAREMIHCAELAAIDEDRADDDFDSAMALADRMLGHAEAFIEHPDMANRASVREHDALDMGLGGNSLTRRAYEREVIAAAFERWARAKLEDGSFGTSRTAVEMAFGDIRFELRSDSELTDRFSAPGVFTDAVTWIEAIRLENTALIGEAAKAFLERVGIDGSLARIHRTRKQRDKLKKV